MLIYTAKDFTSQVKLISEKYLNRVKDYDENKRICTVPAAVNKLLGINIKDEVFVSTIKR